MNHIVIQFYYRKKIKSKKFVLQKPYLSLSCWSKEMAILNKIQSWGNFKYTVALFSRQIRVNVKKKIVYVWGLLSVSRRIFHGRRDLWYVKASIVVFLSHGLCSEMIVFQTRKIALGLWTLLWNDGHQSLLGSLLLNNTCKKIKFTTGFFVCYDEKICNIL